MVVPRGWPGPSEFKPLVDYFGSTTSACHTPLFVPSVHDELCQTVRFTGLVAPSNAVSPAPLCVLP